MAVRRAVAILVANQENYVADAGFGRGSGKDLNSWQAEERKRLAEVRVENLGAAYEWPYEGVYRVGGQIPPGYRVGGTAIVCEALILADGFKDEARAAAVARGVEFILNELVEQPALQQGPKAGYDVRGWAHAYALKLLLVLIDRDLLEPEVLERARAQVPHLIECLAVNEIDGGGWNYGNNQTHSPFQTASTLLALFEAARQDFEIPPGLIDRALDALATGRDEATGAFGYSGSRKERMHASAARAAIAELCLFRAGRSSEVALRRAIAGFFDGWDELYKRKSQQGTHEGPYGIAPYYFYYGHAYTALAIEYLPEAERGPWRDRMREVIWRTCEPHGGWNDRIFPRTESYSTAMVVQALIAPNMPLVPTWNGE